MISELSFPFPWDSVRLINEFKHHIIISKRQSKRWGVTDIEYQGSWQNMYKLNNRTHEGQWRLWVWMHASSLGTMISIIWAKLYWPSMNQPKVCFSWTNNIILNYIWVEFFFSLKLFKINKLIQTPYHYL
jgi:hypothetical protein